MDIYCQKCDEPWDAMHVAEMDKEYDSVDNTKPSERFLNGVGCPCCNWGKDAPKEQSLRGMAMEAMADILGDDLDGMASMMDDFEAMGMLE